MTALLRITAILVLIIGVAVLAEGGERRTAIGLIAGGVGLLVAASAIDRHARHRRAFAKARKGAKEAAREAAREGRPRYVPRRRWWIRARRLIPGWGAKARAARERVIGVVTPHVPALATKRERTVRREYGREEREGWETELAKFLERVVLEAVPEAELDRAAPFVYRWYAGVEQDDARASRHGSWGRRMYCRPDGALARMVDALVDGYVASERYRTADVDVAALTPDAYEAHCARLLRECGWEANVVGGTGDQGADILATRGGVRVALQCKRYARPVGNGAVQEVIAGRHMFDAHGAAVVSPTPFTRAARELAAKTRVVLLHHTELHALEARLAEAGVARAPLAAETDGSA
jgi:Restriction endonuclease